jgi:hypothetical protein
MIFLYCLMIFPPHTISAHTTYQIHWLASEAYSSAINAVIRRHYLVQLPLPVIITRQCHTIPILHDMYSVALHDRYSVSHYSDMYLFYQSMFFFITRPFPRSHGRFLHAHKISGGLSEILPFQHSAVRPWVLTSALSSATLSAHQLIKEDTQIASLWTPPHLVPLKLKQ